MKKGCLFLLVVWVALGLFWYNRLLNSPLSESPWIGILLGLSVVIVLSNALGIVIALRQKQASGKSPGQWGEGDLICVSGQIRAVRNPVAAPFSGKFCSMVEYEVHGASKSDSDSDSAALPDFRGMLMAPSAIQTMHGAVRIVGFPLFTSANSTGVDSPQVYERAAAYLLSTDFKEHPKNPLKMLKDLTDVLADNDGEVKADFRQKGVSVENIALIEADGRELFSADDADFDQDEIDDEDEAKTESLSSLSSSSAEAGAESGAAQTEQTAKLARGLKNGGYSFRETAVENGTEVTVFGTYRAGIQAVDISGGLNKLSHQFHFGRAESVVGKQLRNSTIALIFWGAVCAGAHYFVLEKIGYDVKGLLNQYGIISTEPATRQ